MFTAVLTDAAKFPFSDQDLIRLADGGVELLTVPGHSRTEILKVLPSADALFVYSAQIDEDLLRRMPRCRVVVRCGAGHDNIDARAARSLGIEAAYVPGYGTDDVAEHTLALMLTCARRLVPINRQVRDGHWPAYAETGTMHRLSGSTLGLVGFGRIAQRLATMVHGLGMQVLACDPYVPDDVFAASAVARSTLSEIASRSDVISLHAALSSTTRGLINQGFFDQVRPGAILINTSRGELVDEPALFASLRQGRLAGAGLDVLATEPPARDDPLVQHPHTVITSHSAAFTDEALGAVRSMAVDEVLHVLSGDPPTHPIPDDNVRASKPWQ